MAEIDPKEQLAQEIAQIRELSPKIIKAGRNHFAKTALVSNAPWDLVVDQRIRSFYEEVAPQTPNTLNPEFWDHKLLTSIYARRFAATIALAEVSPLKAQANGFLHDMGRLVLPHRYLVNDIVCTLISHNMGLNPDFVADFAPLVRILGIYQPIRDLHDLTLPQIINELSDVLGRRNPDGDLVTVDDLRKQSPAGRYEGGVWKTEDYGLSLAIEEGGVEFENHLKIAAVEYFISRFGIDFDRMRAQVDAEFYEDRNQEWIRTCQEAHAG